MLSPPPAQPPLSLAALPSGKPSPGEGDATARQVERSPPGALSTLSSAPRCWCRKSCTADLPEDEQVMTGGRRAASGCGAAAGTARDNSICQPKPSPWDPAHAHHSQGSESGDTRNRGLLCYRGPLPGPNPGNTIQALGEATHA